MAAPRTSIGRRAGDAIAPAVAAAVITAAGGAVAACRPPRAPTLVDPPEGITIAVYAGDGQGYAVVDDRRTIEVTGRRVFLDRIDPGAALPTLVIEPLGAARGALAIEQCARERLRVDPADAPAPARGAHTAHAAHTAEMAAAARVAQARRLAELLEAGRLEGEPRTPASAPEAGRVELAAGVASPLVACTVAGAPGRYRVRVHYVAAGAGFQTQHEIAMTAPDRATISTRLIVSTPAWGARGELVLYDGVPGAGDPPREVGRGAATFDGGTAVIAAPPREVPARLVRVYDGMRRTDDVDRTEPAWGKDSQHHVRVLLELDDPQLLRGPAHVRLSRGDGDTHELGTAYEPADPTGAGRMARARVASIRAGSRIRLPVEPPPQEAPARPPAAAAAAAAAGPRRLPLWLDPLLRGTRARAVQRAPGASLTDRVELTLSNSGTAPREIWIEEPLRPARRRELLRARPARPELVGDVARLKVVVGPGQIERVGFTIRYTF